jgi:dienelactone hydrolase
MSRLAAPILLLLATMACATASARTTPTSEPTASPAHEDVEFHSLGITLSGTIFVPAKTVAAVVLVDGAGKTLRKTGLARVLANQGIASLTYDKRGVGKSGGVYAGPEVHTNNVTPENLQLLSADATAAVDVLSNRFAGHHVPIGLIGFSQGGWIAPLVATRSPRVKFMVFWSGPVVTTYEAVRFEFFTDHKAEFWDHHTEAEVREHLRSNPHQYPFIDTDPVESLQKLSLPGLWLFGGRDVSVPTGLSIERLRALAASGKPFEYELYPEADHQLVEDTAIPAIVGWIYKTVGARGELADLGRRPQ